MLGNATQGDRFLLNVINGLTDDTMLRTTSIVSLHYTVLDLGSADGGLCVTQALARYQSEGVGVGGWACEYYAMSDLSESFIPL